jgi:two-component system LytT family sensor kinase
MVTVKKRDWIEVVLHIAFWIGVFYTLLSLTVSHVKVRLDQNGSIMEKDVRHTLSPYIFITLGILVLLFYSNIFWLFKKILGFRNILLRIIIPVAWFCIMVLANQYLGSLLFAPHYDHDPVMRTDSMSFRIKSGAPPRTFLKDNIVLSLGPDKIIAEDGFSNTVLFVFIIVFGLSIAYFFLKEWSKTEKIRLQLEAVQLDTEIKFLKSQVNPHFLFNTLNNLFSMAQGKGNDDLADGISKLSGMMRYMIYESNDDSVPLKKEIEYLENCIVLNKLRYADDEVKVIFDYPDNTEGVFVAPMLFIPFVENAFKHGVSIGQSSQIDISISLTRKQLNFSCQNVNYNFIKKMENEKSGIGLENVKRRLELVYPGKCELFIQDNDDKYIVKLAIDLI